MSLNGLDDPKVKEAYQAAAAEAGGWFLLKYASRDEVELQGRGNGGIVEMRNNIAQYEDKSPLYGFLRYRRRNVIIKYLPEDCSRLVQARVTVHFTSICERFTPYNTVFSLTNAKELKDTKLSAACSLHAASGSTSSSTSSLRRRRLMEIAEEEEEEERERKRQSVVKEEERPVSMSGPDAAAPTSNLPSSPPPVTLNSDLASSPDASHFAGSDHPPAFTGIERPSSPSKSFDDAARRRSLQNTRPDLYSHSSYPYNKPKVKLGPRPSVEVGGRPRTSGTSGAESFRPTAALPAGFKMFSKGGRRGKSQDLSAEGTDVSIKEEAAEVSAALSAENDSETLTAQGTPELLRPHTSNERPTTSSGVSTKSAATTLLPLPSTKQNTITPEKARLMKAMQLRQKKKKMADKPPPLPLTANESVQSSLPEAAGKEDHEEKVDTQNDPEQAEPLGETDDGLSVSNADSGVVVDVAYDYGSVDTRSDSHPASPTAASSEIGESTKASSLSESTDETVQPTKEEPSAAEESDGVKQSGVDTPPATEEEGEEEKEEAVVNEAAEEDDEERQPQTLSTAGSVESLRPVASEDLTEPGAESVHQDNTVDIDELGGNVAPAHEEPEAGNTEETQDEAAPMSPVLPISKFAVEGRNESSSLSGSALPLSKFAAPSLVPLSIPVEQLSPETRTTENETPADSDADTDLSETKQRTAEDEERAQELPQLVVPLSKFSTHESKSPTGSSIQSTPTVITPTIAVESVEEPRVEHSSDDDGSPQQETELDNTGVEQPRSKHKAPLEPIRTDLDIPDTDVEAAEISFSDDEDLLEELHSATLQEAKPMLVSKSPITPVFPAMTSPKKGANSVETGAARIVRTVSNPIRGPLLVPGDVSTSSARSVSSGAAFLHKITQQSSSDLKPKGGKIGSSISQRIKALEKLSSLPPGEPQPKERPSSTFFSVRKTITREPSRSPSVAERANSLTRGRSPTPPGSNESSPDTPKLSRRDRSGSMASRLSLFEGGNLPRGRPESIQVTARIVRDPTQPFPRPPEPRGDDFGPLDLKQSPLVVDHQRAAPLDNGEPAPVLTPAPSATQIEQEQREQKVGLLQRRFSKSRRSQSSDRNKEVTTEDEEEAANRPRRRSSLSVVKDFIKERRDSLIGGKGPSTENLSLSIATSHLNASGAQLTPGRSPGKSPARPPSTHQNAGSVFPRRLSIGSRRSSLDAKSPAATAVLSPGVKSDESFDSGEDTYSRAGAETPTDKRPGSSASGKSSRASRFMRRLSNSLSSGRKAVTPSISPTVAEEEADELAAELATEGMVSMSIPPSRAGSSLAQPTIINHLGDVNVQFPDTLLWKRRTISLDAHGFLILSAVQGVKHQAGAVKRFHLSDFRTPYTPEMEVQELPNSVCLDFVDGSGLQIACEDRAGQLEILHVLQDAHQNHTSFGQ